MSRPSTKWREDTRTRRGQRPSKALGQHFLRDPRMAARIAAAAGGLAGRTVLEVGPGRGALTRALLEAGADEVVAIERDSRLAASLGARVPEHRERLRVIDGDALEIEESRILRRPACVVSNLPYNIAVPLLMKWLGEPDCLREFHDHGAKGGRRPHRRVHPDQSVRPAFGDGPMAVRRRTAVRRAARRVRAAAPR